MNTILSKAIKEAERDLERAASSLKKSLGAISQDLFDFAGNVHGGHALHLYHLSRVINGRAELFSMYEEARVSLIVLKRLERELGEQEKKEPAIDFQAENIRLKKHIEAAFLLLSSEWNLSDPDSNFETKNQHDQWHKHHGLRELKEALGLGQLSDNDIKAAIENGLLWSEE